MICINNFKPHCSGKHIKHIHQVLSHNTFLSVDAPVVVIKHTYCISFPVLFCKRYESMKLKKKVIHWSEMFLFKEHGRYFYRLSTHISMTLYACFSVKWLLCVHFCTQTFKLMFVQSVCVSTHQSSGWSCLQGTGKWDEVRCSTSCYPVWRCDSALWSDASLTVNTDLEIWGTYRHAHRILKSWHLSVLVNEHK